MERHIGEDTPSIRREPRSTSRTLQLALAPILAVFLLLAGCSSSTDTPSPGTGAPTTTASATIRTDPDPIASRFPILSSPQDLHWVGGTATTDGGRVPGPTDVHLQVLAVLDAGAASTIEAGHDWQSAPADWETRVLVPMREFLPAAQTWRTSANFTTEVLGTTYTGLVMFSPDARTVFLDVIST